MQSINLTRGQIAIVCDCHAHLVIGNKWHAHKDRSGKYYAARNASVAERLLGSPVQILMHAVINNTPRGLETDHENRDTLDNRCTNLRTATKSQNRMNQGKLSNNTSGYKGVVWNKRLNKWQAQIKVNKKRIHVGVFSDLQSAALAYNNASRELHGEFSYTNKHNS